MAAVILSCTCSIALADTLWIKNNECKINAYSMYSSLSNFHLYNYYANTYLEYAAQYRKYAKQYKNPYFNQIADLFLMYHQIYNNYSLYFLSNYFYNYFYFTMCEYMRPRNDGVKDFD